ALGEGDRALRACGDDRDPLARHLGQKRGGPVSGDTEDLAVLAAGDERVAGLVADAGEQAVIGLAHLVAMVEPMNLAGSGGEEGDVAKEGRGDDVAVEIEGSDSRHQFAAASQALKLRSIFSRSRSRPMKTRRLSRFSPSFQA